MSQMLSAEALSDSVLMTVNSEVMTHNTSIIRLLLIEDNPADALLIEEFLSDARGVPFFTQTADTLASGFALLDKGGVDVILLDLSLPDSHGFETFVSTRKKAGHIPIILLTGLQDEKLAEKTVQAGAQDYLVKGEIETNLLARSIRYAMGRQRMLRHIERTRAQHMEMKNQFLSHVSHELRTPLSVIHQYITILQDGIAGDLTEDQREFLGIMLDNADQLRKMIGDLLDVTRADSGKLVVERRYTPAREIIESAVDSMRAAALERGIDLTLEAPPNLPAVFADPARVLQVLINLINNAIKFTPSEGRIRVLAGYHGENRDALCIAVSDNGCGISEAGTRMIFERLYQEENSVETSRVGLGLGLHICKELVSRHNGKIWVESTLGEGSTFCFTLPVFSLRRQLRPLFERRLDSEHSLAMIKIELTGELEDNGSHTELNEKQRQRIRATLSGCILPDRDSLLPAVSCGRAQEVYCIAAFADHRDAEALSQRIREQLGEEILYMQGFKVTVSYSLITLYDPQQPASSEERLEQAFSKIEDCLNSYESVMEKQ